MHTLSLQNHLHFVSAAYLPPYPSPSAAIPLIKLSGISKVRLLGLRGGTGGDCFHVDVLQIVDDTEAFRDSGGE